MELFSGTLSSNGTSGAVPSPVGAAVENMAIPHKSLFPELSLYTRIKYFAGLLLLSLILSILALITMGLSLKTFAILYTLGTISCLFSITFLVGPMEQLKSIVAVTRLTASCLLLLFIVFTMIAALKWKSAILAVLFCICQFCSFVWYVLSYVPYARTIMKHFCSVTCSCCVA